MSHVSCDEVLCELVQDTLVKLGRRPLTDCNGSWPCPNLISNSREIFDTLTPDQVTPIFELLQELSPNKLPIRSSKSLLTEEPFPCPEIGISIYQPCQVKSCAFFTDHSWTRNCLLYYRVHQEVSQLSVSELAFLLKRSVGTIRKSLSSTMKLVRKAALKETISHQPEPVLPLSTESRDICIVCGSPIEKTFRRTVKYPYCGDACYLFKPPFMVSLEKEFGLPVERLLHVCINNFRSTKSISQALGITASKLAHISRRCLVTLPD